MCAISITRTSQRPSEREAVLVVETERAIGGLAHPLTQPVSPEDVRQPPLIVDPHIVLEIAQRQRERAIEKAIARHERRKGRRCSASSRRGLKAGTEPS